MNQSSTAIEQAIQAAGANVAPRVTEDDIKANITSEHYFTASQALVGETRGPEWQATPKELDLLTFCVLVLRNGFTVTGESACASPENFKPAIGRQIARENAINKVWNLMGYELRTKLSKGRDLRTQSNPEYTWLDVATHELSFQNRVNCIEYVIRMRDSKEFKGSVPVRHDFESNIRAVLADINQQVKGGQA